MDAKIDSIVECILHEKEILNNLDKRVNEAEIRQIELKQQIDSIFQANEKEFERRNAEIVQLLSENTIMLENQLKVFQESGKQEMLKAMEGHNNIVNAIDYINDEIKMLLLNSVMDQL